MFSKLDASNLKAAKLKASNLRASIEGRASKYINKKANAVYISNISKPLIDPLTFASRPFGESKSDEYITSTYPFPNSVDLPDEVRMQVEEYVTQNKLDQLDSLVSSKTKKTKAQRAVKKAVKKAPAKKKKKEKVAE